MVETVKAIAQTELKNKTIILTGAMIPYPFGSSSDGFFQIRLSSLLRSNFT